MTRPIKLRVAFCISLLLFAFAAHRMFTYTCEAQSDDQARSLEQGKPVESEIAAGQSHHYLLDLVEGQYARVLLEKNSADLILIASRPDGERITEAKGAPPEEALGVILLARVSGKHSLEVRSVAKDGAAARYKLSIAEMRTATEEDRNRVAAAKAYTEGMRLLEKGDQQSLREAIEKYKAAMSLFKAAGERKDEAFMLSYIGYVHQQLKQKAEALESYADALAIHRAIGNREGEATTLYNIARIYDSSNDKRKAIDFYNQALEIYRATNNGHNEAVTTHFIAAAYFSLNEGAKSLDFYAQAVAAYRATGNQRGEAQTLSSTGTVYASLNENHKAIDFFNRAMPLYRATGDRRGEVIAISGAARAYLAVDQYQNALDLYDQMISLCRAIGERAGEASAHSNIGRLYRELGEYERAMDSYQRALALYRSIGNRSSEAASLNNMGGAYLLLNEPQKAIDSFNQSLALIRSLGDQRAEASILNGIGSAHTLLNDDRKAIEFYDQALALSRASGSRSGEAATLNNMGRIYLAAGDHRKALDTLTEALRLIRTVKDSRGEAQMLFNLARAHRATGDMIEARSKAEAAIKIAETLRLEAPGDQLRASFFASVRNFYDLEIDLLMQLHRQNPTQRMDAIAFETSERAHARSLVELLAEARVDIRQGVDASLLERERRLQRSLDAGAERQAQLLSGRHTPDQAAAIAREMETIISDYQQVQAQIRAASPRYAALSQPQPISLAYIQKQLLDEDTLLLEYSLGDERSFLWAVSTDSITSYELPKRAEIEAAARRFYELAKTDSNMADVTETADRLSRMLLAPVAGRIGSKRLVIVADGILHYIPFAALPNPGGRGQGSGVGQEKRVSNNRPPTGASRLHDYRPLIEDHEIVLLPSVAVLSEIRRDVAGRKKAVKAVAVFADPVFSPDDTRLKSQGKANVAQTAARDLQRSMAEVGMTDSRMAFSRLPFSRREAEAITAIAPAGQSMKAMDFQASRSTATSDELAEYRIIHFATHGLLNNTHAELSGVVLSLVDSRGEPQNGFLRLHEIYNLRMPAEMVVLSACQTGLGKEVRGEGLVGLTRGFMYAGAARVVASLWKVDDAATAELMKRFYRGVLEKKLRPAAALREAQAEMQRQERWRSPYFWAAFVLQGEWR